MPSVFLSPSTQEYNPYITGSGSEEYWMNQIADAMEPYLRANGISFGRNDPSTSAAAAIRQGNQGNYDFYLALHSNAAGDSGAGSQRGILAFYYPGSYWGMRAAQILAEGLKTIYPLPDLVRAEPSTSIGEVRRTRAPAVLLELGFHDNPQDAAWIVNNIEAIAANLVRSLTVYFGIPFFPASSPRAGVVETSGGPLNVRVRPDPDSPVIARLYDGARVTVVNTWEGWDLVRFGEEAGYAAAAFIR